MKSIIAILVVVGSMFAMSVSASAATFHGTWIKPVYSVDGLATLSREVVKYDLTVPEGANIGRVMEVMSPVIGMTSLQGQFSSIEEFQVRVNEKLRDLGAPYRNFVIVDITVDER